MNYRGLNKVIIRNRHPLPLISETLDRLSHVKYFTKFDLRDIYHYIYIKRGDEWKTAFRTRYSYFEYMVMPFGLINTSATFQSYINEALRGYLDIFYIIYLDNIMMYSERVEEHKEHVRKVLKRLRQYNLLRLSSTKA
jgi:Reverse transcriptase (RNA-dependent DNA polymerase)